MQKIAVALYIAMIGLWALTGGSHWGSVLVIAIIAVSGCSYALTQSPPKAAPFHGLGLWGWMLLAMILLSILSVLPLPYGILSILSPKSAESYSDFSSLLGENALSWGTISVAPGKTAYALIILTGCLGIYLWTTKLAGSRENMLKFVHVLVGFGGIWIIYMGLKYVGFEIDFGQTGSASPVHIGLPVNPNHASAVLAMLSLLSLGACLNHRHRESTARRTLWFMLYLVFGVALIMLKSRGAILGWGCGHLVLCVTYGMASRQCSHKTTLLALSGMGIVLAAVLYISASTVGEIQSEYESTEVTFETTDQTQLTKTQMYSDFLQMGKDWGKSGTGRSAFADVYPEYQSFFYHRHFRHAENEYWEILLEYGWFFGAILLLLGAAGLLEFFRTFVRSSKEHSCIYGLLAGIFAILVQNCFDFNLRYFTVALPFWMAVGILQGRKYRWKYGRPHKDDYKPNRLDKAACITCISIGIASVLTCILTSGLWYEGHTEKKLNDLRHLAVSNIQETPEMDKLVAENLHVRPNSSEVRKWTAFHKVRLATLGNPQNRTSNLVQARSWYISAQKLSPKDTDISLHLARVCAVLEDEACAVENYLKTLKNDPRKRALVVQSMASLKNDSLRLPDGLENQKAFIEALLKENRISTALQLIYDKNRLAANEMETVELACIAYQWMSMDEACELELDRIRNLPLTIGIFDIRCALLVKNAKFDELFSYMESSEAMLKNEAEYWRLRLYYSVFYGEHRGTDWYRDALPSIFWQFKHVSKHTQSALFDEALCEARYALGRGQYKRAERAAMEALEIRPGHAEALKLLDSAKVGEK